MERTQTTLTTYQGQCCDYTTRDEEILLAATQELISVTHFLFLLCDRVNDNSISCFIRKKNLCTGSWCPLNWYSFTLSSEGLLWLDAFSLRIPQNYSLIYALFRYDSLDNSILRDQRPSRHFNLRHRGFLGHSQSQSHRETMVFYSHVWSTHLFVTTIALNSLKVLSGTIILNERLQRSIAVLRRRTRGFTSTDRRCVRLGGRRNNKQMNETYTAIPIIIHPHIAITVRVVCESRRGILSKLRKEFQWDSYLVIS